MSKTILHTAESRGTTNLGWLHSRHSFSFGDYYDPERIHFGALRVINDDMIAPGQGYGMHPHSNMEIITIPLEGELEYKDDMNNGSVIGKGDVQVMGAGTGVFHSEVNRNKDRSVSFLQIWVVPKVQKAKPHYEQRYYRTNINELTEILSPDLHEQHLWLFQDIWFYMGKMQTGQSLDYLLKKPNLNGVYIFVIQGEMIVNEQLLKQRDGYGLWEISTIRFTAKTECEFLVMEVPMKT